MRKLNALPILALITGTLLVACSGLLLREVARLRERESALVEHVADQERWLAELDLRTAVTPVARTAGLAGSRSWQRVLARTDRRRFSRVPSVETKSALAPAVAKAFAAPRSPARLHRSERRAAASRWFRIIPSPSAFDHPKQGRRTSAAILAVGFVRPVCQSI